MLGKYKHFKWVCAFSSFENTKNKLLIIAQNFDILGTAGEGESRGSEKVVKSVTSYLNGLELTTKLCFLKNNIVMNNLVGDGIKVSTKNLKIKRSAKNVIRVAKHLN